jgi:diguanylate cyclase (GGDEF)-like protein
VRKADPAAVATAALVGEVAGRLVELARLRARIVGGLIPLATSASESEAPAQRRILLADDDVLLAISLSEMLRDSGYCVDTVYDGAAAVAHAHAHPPDLILLDVMMPGIDGFATAERLRIDPVTSQVPVLFLSAAREESARVRGLRLGAADFIAKPVACDELLARVERSLRQVADRERLRSEAHTDELTGLGNLRLLHERLALEQARSERYGTSLALIMIDVDGLKRINDQHGHAAGSAAIAAIGRVLREGTRNSDIAVRYGGDEFLVVLAHATLADGQAFAERLLERIREARPGGLRITASIGVAAGTAQQDRSLQGLFELADSAVYRAKAQGGNCACVPAAETATHSEGAP